MSEDNSDELFTEISRTGYHPEVVSAGLGDALSGEPVEQFVLHHEPTFDGEEIRRHMTVLALTATRLVLVHTDEHPADELASAPYTSTTSEAVPVSEVRSVVVTRVVAEKSTSATEAVLTIGWGSMSRLDLEPARCADPECVADHGYTGSVASDDFTMRLSSTADGGQAVKRLLAFARTLSERTAGTTQAGRR